MRKFIVMLAACCIILSAVIPTLALTVAAQATDNAGIDAVKIDKTDDGLTIANHTESDGINYPDEYYRIAKKLEEIPHTYQAWVKIPESVSGEYVGCIVSNYKGTGTPGFIFCIVENNMPCLYWGDEDKTAHTVKFDVKAENSDGLIIPYDEWTHLTIVHDDETQTVYLYINGELYGTNTTDYAEIQQAAVMRVASYLGGDNRYWNRRYFKGALSTVALYSSALTADEVKDTYENGVSSNFDNLIFLYDIDSESSGNNIIDLSGNGYTAEYGKQWLTEEEMADIRVKNGTVDEDGNPNYAYSFAVVPDIQYLTRYYPENLPKLYEWIVDNKESRKIQYVIGLGDITDSDTDAQWQTAKEAISIMDGKVDYSLVRGNHDVPTGTYFNEYFADDTDYTDQFTNYGGFYKSGSVWNTYRTLRVGETDWLLLNLDWTPNDDVLKWAIKIVKQHPDHKVIISTHAYMNFDGITLDTSNGYENPNVRNNGNQIWTKLASQYENIELVLCGHVHSEDIVVEYRKGVNGNTVTEMLIDFQYLDRYKDGSTIYNKGGVGMVAMLYFDETGSNVSLECYSTIKDKYYKNTNQRTIDLDAECEEVTRYWDGFTSEKPDGDGTATSPYTISGASHLYWIAQQIQNSTQSLWSYHCIQTNDIDLAGFALPSLGGYYSNGNYGMFGGVYDGNGYVIKNGSIVSSVDSSSAPGSNYYASGLFGMISGATIKNVTLDNIVSYSDCGVVGVLVGAANPSLSGASKNSASLNLIENCTVTSTCRVMSTVNVASLDGDNSDYTVRVGGIAGALAYTTVRNCVNEATVYVPGNYAHAGGIAGSLYNDCVIDSSINRGEVIFDFTDTSYTQYDNVSHIAGGIVGSIQGYASVQATGDNTFINGNISIYNCENSGNLVVNGTAIGKAVIYGGIVGLTEKLTSDSNVILHKCVNSGSALGENTQNIPVYVGSIVGYATNGEANNAGTLMLSDYITVVSSLPIYNSDGVSVVSDAHSFASDMINNGDGTHSTICSCGYNHTISLDHNWDKGKVTKAATHTAKGTMTYTCVDCGAKKTQDIAKLLMHEFGEWAITSDGNHSRTCTCGTTVKYSHSMEYGKNSDGCTTYACSYCSLDTTEHVMGEWTEYSETEHSKTCPCGNVNYGLHNWDNGIIVEPATEVSTGLRKYTCTLCGAEKTEIIPMLPIQHKHDYSITNFDANNHWNECLCGETKEGSVAPHAFDNACDTTCDCGYVREITHDFTVSNNDDTHHWVECSVCGAVNEETREAHKGGEATCINRAVCEVCSKEYGELNADNHDTTGVTGWTKDSVSHWQVCNCGAKINQTNHRSDAWISQNNVHYKKCDVCDRTFGDGLCHGGEATCESKAVCEVCNNAYGELADHEYGTEWKSNDTHHWHGCACGAKADEAEHEFGKAVDGVQTCECGHTQQAEVEETPDENTSFFGRIFAAIAAWFKSIGEWFKNLFS